MSEITEQQKSTIRWNRFVAKNCICGKNEGPCTVHALEKDKKALRLQWARWMRNKLVEEEMRQ